MKQYKLKELCILTNTTRSAIQGYHRHQLINYESKDKKAQLTYFHNNKLSYCAHLLFIILHKLFI